MHPVMLKRKKLQVQESPEETYVERLRYDCHPFSQPAHTLSPTGLTF